MTAVLVAEDDPDQLKGLTTFLRHAGFDVYGVQGGEEALAVAEEIHPAAAICDWNLGEGPDGAEVIAELQATQPDLVPIFITGNDLAALRCRTRQLREAAYFSKPIAPQRLLDALRSAGCRP